MQYNFKVESFEGPLDLLLHLIHRYEIDIYNIPVAEITEQYLSYIHTMKELQLDVASEYLVMAATLLQIKSKMLLPKQEEDVHDSGEDFIDDPRQELMERLIEYKKYKQVAAELKEREQERAQLYTRPPIDFTSFQQEEAANLPLDVTLYDMLAAFQKMMRRKKSKRPVTARITRQEIPIEQRMTDILQKLETLGGRQSFYDLFADEEREVMVVTFLAILELMKHQQIVIEQEQNFDEIFLSCANHNSK
ncbi:segregation/condensation protein A [Bacillus cytotoxicus]|uniref:Segregation and condensation protein A n=2 Tax=Bacillus cytotoxicus TaxID=580165 RepID=SCPA_BACCN|nr:MULTISPECIES: segregation/condensation protein A [Bacillus cereus group]A7GS82.1 RecName: Full=Segregation and condensation protein A [Bacillus cytotoxicus NVH 391-98]ABS22990.1 chromosome segregation and condensation protein ScpA [Bacillus cytotoxicus NVH 391-98]AWC29644.1 segregation/condensation protein A [Bacillus cytotoxicus]AWC33650.1 segregation/condensation protein A [Bacillus cytotoxicus]AWC37628.1 segregation/condensation protein A [Bacillus cytotoxicus]AWC41776.1 segregation/con